MQTTLKTLDAQQGRIGGYLVVWGDQTQRDLQGEYFTPETDLGLDWYKQRPVLYHHGLDGAMKAAVIGVIDTLRADETGLWAEAQLDIHKRYVRTVQQLVQRGILGWSSGSLPHLVEVAEDGRIKQWPIVEGSLTPTPAEPRRTDARMIKSAYDALGLDTARLKLHPQNPLSPSERKPDPMYQDDNTPRENARKHLPLASTSDAYKSVEVGSPYDQLDAMDLLHGYMLLRNTKSFRGVSETYANALAHKVRKSRMSSRKADELSYSTQTNFGDEWVPDMWSAQIWNKARMDNVILPLFQSVEMPSSPFELPIEGTDPTVYFVPETTDEAQLALDSSNPAIPDSKIGSGKVRLNAKKLALRVGFSAELVEDAIVPVLNIYREQAMRAITDSIDHVLLNGDTALTGNVNKAGGTPNATDRYMAFDGLRKLPLVTTAANSVDANGAPTLAKLRETRFKMPTRYAARPSDLVWITDGGTYAQFLGMQEFLTMDKAGPLATAQTGQIGFADGVPVVVSAEMPLTSGTDGKVSHSTPANNTKGSAICVYRPGWFVGYRRRIAVSVDYLPYYDAYQLTATVRLAFINFDGTVASALYNVTV
jgi:HK97 family phage major capsid protein